MLQQEVLFQSHKLTALNSLSSAISKSLELSEILAGALQDRGRATVIGQRTFGKGTVQGLFRLESGGAIGSQIAQHELTNPQCLEAEMDQHNNAVGREIGNRLVHQGATSRRKIAEHVKNALDAGRLKVIETKCEQATLVPSGSGITRAAESRRHNA